MTERTTPKTIRMGKDTAEWLKGKDARLLVESTCDLIQSGRLEFDESGVHSPQIVKSETIVEKETTNTSEGVHNQYPKSALKCIEESLQILSFWQQDVDYFWEDLLNKIVNGDLTKGTLGLGESPIAEAAEDEEVQSILKNLANLCDERDVPLDKAYKNVLMIGAKIVYKDVQGAKLG